MVRKSHLSDSLKEGSRGQSGARSESRLRNLLVTVETALTVVLIVGAGLLLKSFVLLQQTDLGLNPHNVVMADLLLSKRYAEPFSLADSKTLNSFVFADHRTVGGYEFARRIDIATLTPNKLIVSAARYETNFLAILLIRHSQTQASRDSTNRRLLEIPNGQHHPRQ